MEDGNHESGNGKQPMKPSAESNNGGPRQPPPSQPPQQCPRCNSFHTKFCYYNNYSLSQPRYFCKNCRRYWTQGGTLRNVPIGGGCRKGAKRLVKGSTSGLSSSSFTGESSRSQEQLLPPPPPPPLPALAPPHMRGFSSMSSFPFANPFYSTAGGILPSFGAMQNLNRPMINGAGTIGGGGSSTNLSLLQGLVGNQNMNSRPSQVQQLYQSSDLAHQMMAQPNRSLGSWTRGFINNPNSVSTNTNVSWAQNMVLQPNNNTSGSGLARTPAMNNPNQWPDEDHLSGYGPPPPSS